MGNALGGVTMDDQEKQPDLLRWEPGMELSTEEEREAAIPWLAAELLREKTPEQLAIIAARQMIFATPRKVLTYDVPRGLCAITDERRRLKALTDEALVNKALVNNTAKIIRIALKAHSTYKARKTVDGKHDKPGASRDLKRKIQAVWATGKYSSRDTCADEEWVDLGYGSFCAARKALRNTPDPT
jgi:hypothetical protein